MVFGLFLATCIDMGTFFVELFSFISLLQPIKRRSFNDLQFSVC